MPDNQTVVRIREIELKDFKNTKYGCIDMPSTIDKNYFSTGSDILGIYGQNGSGKTAVIEAMELIQTLLSGENLSRETVHYISKDSNTCAITVKFTIKASGKMAIAEYSVELKKSLEDEFEISHEVLCAAIWNGTKFEKKKTLIDYSSALKGEVFTPKYRFEELVRNNDENKVNLNVAKKIAQKDKTSFIFSTEGRMVFLSATDNISADYAYIIHLLYEYANINLFVISNVHSSAIGMNFFIPFAFRLDLGDKIAKGDLPIRLDGPSEISRGNLDIVQQIIDEMNIVLCTIIPDFSIGVYNFGEQLLETGSTGHKIELISKRGNITIPLKYESEGIIKIISVLNVLMCVYNNSSMCLIIDELDAGIYEYLLGELLSVFEKGANGQLIFTSHNLRALEMLNKSSIIFSTTNPLNRYIRLQNVKSNNNLRDMYLRSIILGGQKENIYAETDSIEIGRAFRRAGKAVQYGRQN